MDDFAARWCFKRTSVIPILDCIGEADSRIVEPFLFETAINYIEQAKKFKGIPVQGNIPQTKSRIAIYFSLQFPSEKEFSEFTKAIQQY